MPRGVRDSTDHEQVVLALLREACGELPAGKLHDRYQAGAETLYRGRLPAPLRKRGLRNVLTRLAGRGVIDAEGDGSTRVYRLAETSVHECRVGA
jgi:DNA-binding transcriptional ArsR family regulator